ncbi:hypothetical protein OIU76_010371 [Salix suchowensis]|uniref:Uncharacterized protein n=1 Tax=Salix suchowensis TaxID=1278906 RepID=A0ABQ9BD27_9ROSI|nr:hypothetical protein OIU76_010371 [Salix suchowensis]KAJ6380998.1 hypothetical protein OIU77_029822 [Salix suchowensis]
MMVLLYPAPAQHVQFCPHHCPYRRYGALDQRFWFIRRQHLIDVTEVFRNLNTDKKRRMIKLGVYMIFFAIFIFRIGTGILVLFNSEELDIRSSFFEF